MAKTLSFVFTDNKRSLSQTSTSLCPHQTPTSLLPPPPVQQAHGLLLLLLPPPPSSQSCPQQAKWLLPQWRGDGPSVSGLDDALAATLALAGPRQLAAFVDRGVTPRQLAAFVDRGVTHAASCRGASSTHARAGREGSFRVDIAGPEVPRRPRRQRSGAMSAAACARSNWIANRLPERPGKRASTGRLSGMQGRNTIRDTSRSAPLK